MSIKVLLFGVLAEIVSSQEISLNDVNNTNELIELLTTKYPKLNNVKFAISINHKIITNNTDLSENDEIALLPPFAGG